MKKQVFICPAFARGTGLGNRLFQWARARVYHYSLESEFINPFWLRFSPGHLLRGTVPLNQFLGRIALAGLFTPDPRDLRPISSSLLRLRCRVLRERLRQKPTEIVDHKSLLYIVDGRDDSFTMLNPYQARLHTDLLRIITPHQQLRADRIVVPPIGINLRLGKDFAPPPSPERYKNGYDWVGWLQQTPLTWFLETLQLIRARSGWHVPAVVVSDGSAEQLKLLLQLPAVKHLSPSNAIVDLLVLSRTRLLLGSGSSTFSAWAAFLGQQPAFTAPGHPFSTLDLQPLKGQLIAAFDPRQPDSAMLNAMVAAVN